MKSLQRLEAWHQTSLGLAIFAVAEAGLAYATASWAIDSGSLLAYTLTLILVLGVSRNVFLFVKGGVRRGV